MRSIIPGDSEEYCFLCNSWMTVSHVHHCLHGSHRKKADEDGLTVHLCPRCHALLHDRGFGDRYLEQLAEETWEQTHPGESFMERYGKSWQQ